MRSSKKLHIMKHIIQFFTGLCILSMTYINVQAQSSNSITQQWKNNPQNLFEQINNSNFTAPATIENGFLTQTGKKYHLLMKKPNLEEVTTMPQAWIDDRKEYKLQILKIE